MREKVSFWTDLKKYFSMKGFLTDKNDVVTRINDGISFRGPNLWVLVFAILTASLGLNMNSTAVIIGAMLISPLMGPIIGMGFAVGTNDFDLLKKSLKNYLISTVISLITATLYFFITPYHGAQSELLARTSPTIYDVLIAACGGAAGIVALSAKDKGNIIPGVAIATALMPPLCTAGFGIASLSLKYFFGAFYLYFINTVFIALATFIGVRAMNFRRKIDLDDKSYKKVRRYLMTIIIITMVPAAIMTVNIIGESIFKTSVERFLNNELKFSGTQIISQNADHKNKTITLAAVGREITESQLNTAIERLPRYGLDNFSVNLIQGRISDSLISLNSTLSSMTATKEEMNATIKHQSGIISELEKQVADFTKYETLTKHILVELRTFYPEIHSLSISNSIESGKDTSKVKHFISAQITFINNSSPLTATDESKIREFIKNRVEADSLALFIH